MAEVHLPRSLAALFPGTPRRVSARGATVAEVIADLDRQVPGIRNRIVDAGPAIRTHINVFVSGERATLDSSVAPDATIHVVPAVSGGAEERSTSLPGEATPVQAAEGTTEPDRTPAVVDPIADPRALQILSTEHWSLLSARALVYNEAFARGGMFLALLSASLVALGLISTATGFSDAFLSVTAVILTLDLFVGLATLGRISAVSNEDIRYLQGMNRIRHAYHGMVPGIERYFITSGYDDFDSVTAFYGEGTASNLRGITHGLTTMPGMVAVICSGIAAVLAAVIVILATHDDGLAATIGVATFIVIFAAQALIAQRVIGSFQRGLTSIFPRPED